MPAMDSQIGASLVYVAVRDSLIESGVDLSSHPYAALEQASRAVWEAAWNRIVAELAEREYVFARWDVLRQMIEGDPNAAMMRRALRDAEAAGE